MLYATRLPVLFLLFYLDDDCYALDVLQIARVLPLVGIKRIPHAPSAIAGAFDYRGQAVPVIDLCALALDRPSRRLLSTRIVLVHYVSAPGSDHLLGLMVERATGTLRCASNDFRASAVANPAARYLGPVVSGPTGIVQQVTVDALLTPALQALLFDHPPGV